MLQAAFTVGCESRGIEVVPERCRVAEVYDELLHEMVDEVTADMGCRNVRHSLLCESLFDYPDALARFPHSV